ncbi:dihydroorotase [Leptolyngbya cf. ectocarpi LEGE 11479]|uniref:Dihydroorotase n=1 Tax=Leptolyngbya cf. ectocarpi LEGE 11479 TaxID=1828722 RepID=A0A928X170_LEPEC|nr:dihydroorotase [Leptolyngbya ectocarpi]MBE9065088.1 dihydroorotase [Leptolyngbya cf. ectocarpi LEGE 11479]
MDSWIRKVRILDPLNQRDQLGDVLIRDGVIQAMGPSLEIAGDVIDDGICEVDGQGCVLGPGLVDLYSQTGEPGHESRETLEQLLQAAAQGGFTRVGILPNTVPAMDSPAQLMLRLTHGAGEPQVLPWGAITRGTQGEQLTDLMELSAAGVVGFADGQSLTNKRLVQRLLEYTQPLSLPLALWACDRTQSGVCRDGPDAIRLGLSGLPITAETIPLTALLEDVAMVQRPVHLMRISTARGVELIRRAKSDGLPITASVTWLHLLFSTAELDSYAPSLRLAPPLGTPEDRSALIAGLEDGTLDAIAVDHCAHTYEEKAVPFSVAPPGTVGLQLALPVLWQTFVATQRWSALQLWNYLSLQPSQCLGLEPASIEIGSPANLVLFDPNHTWTATSEILGCDILNTPYGDQAIQGQAKHIWV